MDSYLVLRGTKTLAVRMRAHAANARMALATWLEAHPAVEKVIYPGLKSHPQHALAQQQASGFGGMISVVVKGGLERARSCWSAAAVLAGREPGRRGVAHRAPRPS
jgi:cystathionine gamma-lyase